MKKSYTKYIKSAYNGPHKYFIPYSLIKGLTIAQYRNTTILDSAQSAETAGLAGFALTITLKTVTGCCSIQSAGAMWSGASIVWTLTCHCNLPGPSAI